MSPTKPKPLRSLFSYLQDLYLNQLEISVFHVMVITSIITDSMETCEKIGSTNLENINVPEKYTDAEIRKVVRKLDWHLLPLCFILYTFSVLDRSNLGNARLAGLQEDLDLKGDEYQWLGTA